MNADRILYRTRQFWQAVGSKPSAEDMALVYALLTASQRTIFTQMQNSEQAHAVLVLRRLLDQHEDNQDLLVAALLHDVGKSRFPLRLWERVVVVLAKNLCPGCVQCWGEQDFGKGQIPHGWRRAFMIAAGHPDWGAEMAAEAGCSQLTVSLIRRHQEKIPLSQAKDLCIEDRLLLKLQTADDES
jgi:hypothetical protein